MTLETKCNFFFVARLTINQKTRDKDFTTDNLGRNDYITASMICFVDMIIHTLQVNIEKHKCHYDMLFIIR